MRKISMVVAMTPERVIGQNNQLLWHLPNDLKHFKALTLGKPIVMGRKTFESIGKPLPNRQNIVLTQQRDLVIPGCEVVHSIQEVLAITEHAPEIMIVGGAIIYDLFIDLTQTLYLTLVQADLKGDTYFSAILEEQWQETAREAHFPDEKHQYAYTFITLEKR